MNETCLWLLMRWGRIESQLLLRGEACGCCCGDGSTADDDGSPADGIMRWLRKQQRLQAVRTAEGIGAALGGSSSSATLETHAAMLPCSTGQAARLPCCTSPTALSYCVRRTMAGWIMADWMYALLVYVQLRSRGNFN